MDRFGGLKSKIFLLSSQTCEPSEVARPLPQADGYLLAFSLTDAASFAALASLLPRLPFAAPCLPVATKADLGEQMLLR